MQGLILAAGSSSRLGEPKQLVRLAGETMLCRTVHLALEVCTAVHVVLGEETVEILAEKEHLLSKFSKVMFHSAKEWREGMGSSLAFGLRQVTGDCIVFLCDLPFLRSEHLVELTRVGLAFPMHAIVSRFAGQAAPPVCIPQCLQAQFLTWSGDQGLANYWKNNPKEVQFVDFDTAYRDLDTAEDKAFWEDAMGENRVN
jgi:molybdenum cofactor cytidylyltransferase